MSQGSFLSRTTRYFDRFIEPVVRLDDAKHEKARLLAFLLLLLIGVDFIVLFPLGFIVSRPPDLMLHLGGVFITVVAMGMGYALCRFGHPYKAGVFMIVVETGILFALAITRTSDNILMLYFLLVVMLFANFFFSALAGGIVCAVHVVMMLLLPFFTTKLELATVIERPVTFYIISAIICTAFGYVRDHIEVTRQERLKVSEARFRAAVDGSFDAFYLIDSLRDSAGKVVDFRIIDVNPRSETQLGIQRSNIIGRTISELMLVWLEFDFVAKFTNVVETGIPLDEEIFNPRINGGAWIHFQVVRVGDGVAIFTRNITQQKHEDAAVRENITRYELITEAISGYAFSMRVDTGGVLVVDWITDSFYRLMGHSAEDIKERGLQSFYHPDDMELVITDIKELALGKRIGGDYRVITKGGETRWIHLMRWPEWDEQQQRVVRYHGVAQDITERKLSEEAKHESERMRIALETERELSDVRNKLMITISHEFRTPLATIQASSDILHRYFDRMSTHQRQNHTATIHSQVRHLAEMLEDITFALQNTTNQMLLRVELIDLVEVCQKVVTDSRYTLAENQTLTLETNLTSLEMVADPKLIKRAIRNLITNAIKYSPDGGTITVEVRAEANEGVVHVRDQGIGISPEEQNRIFQPFYRVSNIGTVEGTGIGLSIVTDCLALHNGSVSVESELGSGSTFTIRLPRTENLPAEKLG